MDAISSEAVPQRYHSVSIVLHWLMAIGFFLMLGSGVVLEYVDLERSFKFQMFQWHKSGGVIMLVSVGLRIVWRLISEIKGWIPAIPEGFPRLEKIAAKLGHVALYVLMFAMPFSGWLMVSSSSYGAPTIVFGWFEWPHVPGAAGNEVINGLAKQAHYYLAIAFGVTIAVHIAAVVKHKVSDGENLLTRMWWSR